MDLKHDYLIVDVFEVFLLRKLHDFMTVECFQ